MEVLDVSVTSARKQHTASVSIFHESVICRKCNGWYLQVLIGNFFVMKRFQNIFMTLGKMGHEICLFQLCIFYIFNCLLWHPPSANRCKIYTHLHVCNLEIQSVKYAACCCCLVCVIVHRKHVLVITTGKQEAETNLKICSQQKVYLTFSSLYFIYQRLVND